MSRMLPDHGGAGEISGLSSVRASEQTAGCGRLGKGANPVLGLRPARSDRCSLPQSAVRVDLARAMKPKALDLFCGAGGATKGLQRAGFHVTGVDLAKQPRYCGDEFHQADAMTFPIEGFDFIWASPPCQRYSFLAYKNKNAHEHPDLIGPVRERLLRAGVPYIIENVMGARKELLNPVMLCGTMFNLGIPEAQLWRHRLFESNILIMHDLRCHHRGSPVGVYGWGGDNRRFGVVTVTGHTGGTRKRGNLQQYNVAQRREAMGIDWMTNAELSEAIPPAYSEFLGRQILKVL